MVYGVPESPGKGKRQDVEEEREGNIVQGAGLWDYGGLEILAKVEAEVLSLKTEFLWEGNGNF